MTVTIANIQNLLSSDEIIALNRRL